MKGQVLRSDILRASEGAKTHVTIPKPNSALLSIPDVRASLPQDSLTNRNKLIAECSDSPAQGVHELACPKQRWDDDEKKRGWPILKLHLGDGSCWSRSLDPWELR